MAFSLSQEKTLSKLFSVNLLVIAADLLVVFIKRSSLPEQVPLFYSRPWGQEQLAAKDYLFLVPLASFLVFILNYYLSLVLLKKGEKFLTILSSGLALLFSVLGAITLWKIIFLIT